MADTTFEPQLARRLVTHTDLASRPFDAGEIARAAIATSPSRASTRPALRRLLLVLAACALLVIALSGAIVVGSFLVRESAVPRPAPGTLAIGSANGFLLAEADGTGARMVDPRGPFFGPRWSPDGAMVAVTALLPDDMNSLAVFDAGGNLVGTSTEVVWFDWSRDSRRIAVVTASGDHVRIVPVFAGEPDPPEVRLPEGTTQVGGVAWLPDGRIVAAVSLAGEPADGHGLWILDPAAGTATRMAGDAGRNGILPAVSPDGRRIAMGVPCGDDPACRPRLRIVDTTTGARVSEIENLAFSDRAVWAPDGSGIAYSYTLGGRVTTGWWDFDVDVRQVDPWSEGPTTVSQVLPGGAGLLVVHPSGPSGPSQLWRLPLDGTPPVLLADDAYGGAFQPATASPAPTPRQSGGAWVPPSFEGGIPDVVALRAPVPFCGVDGGAAIDPARECLQRGIEQRAVVELATDRRDADGARLVQLVRTTPTGGAEVTWLTVPPGREPRWERQTCGAVLVRGDAIQIGECAPLEVIE